MQEIEKFIVEATQNPKLIESQFLKSGQFNILFVNPELTGNDFFKLIMPAWKLKQTEGVIATAFTSVLRYNPTKKYKNLDDYYISGRHIAWANSIVFPFSN